MLKFLRQRRNQSRFVHAWHARDLDAAVTAGRALLQDIPDDYQLQNNVGAVFLEAEQLAEAEQCFRRANELKEHAVHVNNLGRVLLAQRRFDEARDAFRHAIELDPGDVQPQYNLVLLLRKEGKTEAADDALRQFVSDHPTHAGGQNDIGNILDEQGDTDGALAAYLRALELSPDYVPACLNAIRLLCDAGRYPESVPLLERLAARGMRVRVNANAGQVEIDIDGQAFYRGTIH